MFRLHQFDKPDSLPRVAIMTRKYWMNLFTGTTWEEFLEHGAKISGL